MSSVPPAAGESSVKEPLANKKRPRWLVAALVAALVFGAGCWTEGCERLSFYRGDRDARVQMIAQLKDENDRTRVDALYKQYVDIADANRSRGIPLAAATFVLGAALLALAGRGLTGRANARAAIMQVVAAQAIVVAASFFVLKDVRRAEWDWQIEYSVADRRASASPEQIKEAEPIARALMRAYSPTWLAIRSLASALILFALSRQRSREFFEAAAGQVPER
jgi:hypothetical protein